MSDDNQADDQKGNSGGALSEFFENGGILQVAIGKAASKAIGRLIGGVVDVPAAGLESVVQRIRDNTKARSKVTDAIATAASKKASKDPVIVDRALERWAGVQVRKQENREAIAEKTIEHLKHEPPTDQASEGPSDDFMNLFESLAENASSEKLQDLFARVLAGEIRKSGAFSLRTLQVISVMDQKLAEAIENLRQWSSSRVVISYDGFNKGTKFNTLVLLSEYGLLNMDAFNIRIMLEAGKDAFVQFYSKAIVISDKQSKDLNTTLDVYVLTNVAVEIMSLLPPNEDLEVIQGVVDYLNKTGLKAGIVDVTDLGDNQVSIFNQGSISSSDLLRV
jgi:hypothetical protein